MVRPLRINYEGGVYHITSRGNERKNIFRTDDDRRAFLGIMSNAIKRYGWICHAYSLMDNHYHLLIETPIANLSHGMRQLNGVYTQYFNRVHKRAGHLFQGRFKAIIVQKDMHLLELCRYIVLNPVRAKMCMKPEEYPWSSYKAWLGNFQNNSFLSVDWILSQFGAKRREAVRALQNFVLEGMEAKPWEDLKGQIYYGSDEFIESLDKQSVGLNEIPRQHKHPLRPDLSILVNKPNGIKEAYCEHGYKMKEIAECLGVHYATISRKLKRLENTNV